MNNFATKPIQSKSETRNMSIKCNVKELLALYVTPKAAKQTKTQIYSL